jgi:energy-coupling factor transport system ATP-binding protein
MIAPTVEEEIAFGMENQGLDPKTIRRRVDEILEHFGIAHLGKRSPSQISGGERQKVSLASVIAMSPEVLLLDEPTAYLDPASTEEFFRLLEGLDGKLSIVIVEHKLEHVYRFMDRYASLDNRGRITARGSKADFEKGAFLPWKLHELAKDGTQTDERKIENHPVVRIDDVSHAYEPGKAVLKHISTRLYEGETVTLMGPNGAGKTTLLEKIAGLLKSPPDCIRLGDTDVTALPHQKLYTRLLLLPQNPEHFFLKESVEEELSLAHKGASADRFLEPFQLDDLRAQNPYRLSEGEKRRLTLACAVLEGRPILLMDEPAYGLDYSAYEALVRALRKLKESGISILMATHSPELAFLISDRILFLDQGKLVFSGKPDEMLHQQKIPSTLYLPIWKRTSCPKE